jgi:hypothetical protein
MYDEAKKSRSQAAARQSRARARKLDAMRAKGEKVHDRCRECGKPIKPSMFRAFCKGGRCRKAFKAKTNVARVVTLERGIPQPPSLSLLPWAFFLRRPS